MTTNITAALHVLALTDKGVQCATNSSTGSLFWLPRDRYVAWVAPPKPGAFVTAIMPQWLAEKHRQLVGDVEFERVKHADDTDTRKETTMADKPEDAGRGALFKNEDKEKATHPDYKGDVTIRGRKFWVSAWIKTSEKSGKKFMSLAFREAEERGDAKPKAKAPAMADEIPF